MAGQVGEEENSRSSKRFFPLLQARSTFLPKKNGPATHFPGGSAGPQGMGDLRFIRKRLSGKCSVKNKKNQKNAGNNKMADFSCSEGQVP